MEIKHNFKRWPPRCDELDVGAVHFLEVQNGHRIKVTFLRTVGQCGHPKWVYRPEIRARIKTQFQGLKFCALTGYEEIADSLKP